MLNSTAPHHLPVDHTESLALAVTIASGLSIAGSLFNLSTTILIRKTWTTLGRMVVALSLSIIFSATVSFAMQYLHLSSLFCQGFSFMSAFGIGSTLAWSGSFAHALFNTSDHMETRLLKRIWKRYLAICFLIPLLMGIGSVATGFYTMDDDDDACVQTPVTDGFNLGNLLVVIIPSVVSTVFCIVCELSVIKTISKTGSKMKSELVFFPLIFAICTLPTCLQAVLVQINGKVNLPSGLLIALAVLSHSQGIWNALAYGFSQKIRHGLKELCCKKKKITQNSLLKSVDYTHDVSPMSSVEGHGSVLNDSRCSIA